MKKLLTILLTLGVSMLFAQELQSPSFGFSHKKNAYVTLKDGTQVIGTIKDLDRKKGIIKEVEITDGSGKKMKLAPADVSFMYLPPSGLDKVSNAYNTLSDTQEWKQSKLDENLLSQGLVYFEQTEVKVKKKTMTLLAQLLNPDFSAKVKIYHDPMAKETKSIGIAGFDVAGGIAKSYYIKKEGDPAAYLFEKAGYKKEFSVFWNCAEMDKIEESLQAWRDLAMHVATYTTKCN